MRRRKSKSGIGAPKSLTQHGHGGLVLPFSLVALTFLIFLVARSPEPPPDLPMYIAPPQGLQIFTLAPTFRVNTGSAAVFANATLDVVFHRLEDKFGMIDSGLSDDQIVSLIDAVNNIWTKVGINVRINPSRALQVERLDDDRSKAYLFYVFGHPRIPPNDRKTQIINLTKNSKWIVQHYQSFLNDVLPPLDAFCGNARAVAVALKLLPSTTMADFTKAMKPFNLFQPDRVFVALSGQATYLYSPQAVQDSMAVINKPLEIRRLHLAFRKFYQDHGLSPERSEEFALVMKPRPMLFLHYAMGRDVDLTTHEPKRSEWETKNTLAIYPVYYYHDLNGRGSTNWLDVVFRTSSCRSSALPMGTSALGRTHV